MADSLICLDIHKESLIAVAVDRTARGTVSVTGCAKVELAGLEFTEGLEQVREQLGRVDTACRITLGAEMFSFRRLSLPFTERRKIDQVLLMELADLTPADIETMLVDYVVTKEHDEAELLVAMLPRKLLGNYLAALESAAMTPEFVGISGLDTALALAEESDGNVVLVEVNPHYTSLFLLQDGTPALIRTLAGPAEADGQNLPGERIAAWVQQTLLASRLVDVHQPDFVTYISGPDISPEWSGLTIFGAKARILPQNLSPLVAIAPAVQLSMRPDVDRALAVALRKGRKNKVFDFLKDEFRKTRTFHEQRRLAWQIGLPLVVCCLVAVGYFSYSYRSLSAQHDRLKVQIVEVFRETLPEMTKIVNPVRQLQVVINEIKQVYRPGGVSVGRYTVIDILSELSSRIPPSYSVRVVRMVADMDTIRFKALTGDFNTVDNVQKVLQKSPYFKEVVISSANQAPQGDEVSFEMKLVLAGDE